MTKEQKQVKEWMNTFGQNGPDKPTLLKNNTKVLRAKLILEETFETITKGLGLNIILGQDSDVIEIDNNNIKKIIDGLELLPLREMDLVETVDGLADLHYVAYAGTGEACGVDMEPIFAEVHRSNMSKLWTKDEIDNSHLDDLVVNPVAFDGARRFLVKRKDGKVVKSPSYSEANLSPLLQV